MSDNNRFEFDPADLSLGDTGTFTPVPKNARRSQPQRSTGSSGQNGKKRKKKKKRAGSGRILRGAAIALGYIVGVAVISFVLATLGWHWAEDVLALDKDYMEAEIQLTDRNANLDDVTDLLYDEGFIEYKFLFRLFANLTNKGDEIVAGTYVLTTEMDYSALLSNLSASSDARSQVSVTITEGMTVDEIITLLVENDVNTQSELEEAAANYQYSNAFVCDFELGNINRLEGYLFPDTYYFYQGGDAADVFGKMLTNFSSHFTDELKGTAEAMGYTVDEIITIASIIEKETDGTDQVNIASVIYNRLENTSAGTNGYLQMDSTIQYILDERTESLANDDLAIDSPYNTYLYKGLPAGPISNPGMAAITAALNPAQTDYYYFYLGDDGVHHFFTKYDDFVNFKNSLEG